MQCRALTMLCTGAGTAIDLMHSQLLQSHSLMLQSLDAVYTCWCSDWNWRLRDGRDQRVAQRPARLPPRTVPA